MHMLNIMDWLNISIDENYCVYKLRVIFKKYILKKMKLGSTTVMNESNMECGWPNLISRHQVTLIQQPDINVEE
jgi:hypothetical protein